MEVTASLADTACEDEAASTVSCGEATARHDTMPLLDSCQTHLGGQARIQHSAHAGGMGLLPPHQRLQRPEGTTC